MSEDRAQVWVVLHPFGSYTKGQIITDKTKVAELRAAGQGSFVVATSVATAPMQPSNKPDGN